MYSDYQKDSDELRAWLAKGKEEDWVDDEGNATGPTGHLYVAVSNLLDYSNAETTTDEGVERALSLAKCIMNEL